MFPYCHRTSPAQSQWRSMMSALQDHHRDQAQRRSRPWHLRDENLFGQWGARGSPASAGGRAHCTRPWRQERAAKRAPPAMLTGRYTGFHSFPQITATGTANCLHLLQFTHHAPNGPVRHVLVTDLCTCGAKRTCSAASCVKSCVSSSTLRSQNEFMLVSGPQ